MYVRHKAGVAVSNWRFDVTLDWEPAFLHGFAFPVPRNARASGAATNVKNHSFAASYTTLDIGVRYAARVFRCDLNVRVGAINVTDTRYYSSVADGSIVRSPGANTACPGAPRTVLASVEVDP
jgi:iron complex outermembrane receptor protein